MTHARRVLIVTTTFYPDPSVGGVRMTQWARCLPDFGWQPMVLTRYYGHVATPELLAEYVHPDVRLEYLNPPAPAAGPAPAAAPRKSAGMVQRAKIWVGRSPACALAVPDPGIKFWRAVRPRVLRAVEEFNPDLLVTTGPPHSNHDVGLWLAETKGIPWVADFRDPYVIDARFAPRWPFRWMMPAHKAYADRMYRRASLVTHAIPIAARFWRQRSAESRERVRIFTNACAPELAAGRVEPELTPGGRKSIRAIGHIGDEESLLLARALAELARAGHDVELRLVGPVPGTIERIREVLGERVVSNAGVRHDVALRLVAGADVLVNFLSRERSEHYLLSSKLFEYLATPKPVIEVNPTIPDRHLLRGLPDVEVLREPSLAELRSAVERALAKPADRRSPEREAFVKENEWRRKVGVLATWFNEVLERGVGGSDLAGRTSAASSSAALVS